ncbi:MULTISPECIES: phosphoribosylglycinamide formyltransferase [unclassified Helicobacter]|uniref:phosphoribosylglycinamide formyltransferase n=1 Tax=unclassified Helicobacter TaxID=2593540 RepID=UPI000CF16248|nr:MULTISPECIES: phosphoribosylglycinamide formyltransferase [unclassified Helicobacter]
MIINKRIVILFSGNGSNLENIIKQLHQKIFNLNNKQIKVEVSACICNKPQAFGIKRAEKLGIKCFVIPHKDFKNSKDFEIALEEKILPLEADLIVLAGFMRILGKDFVNKFKIINIHPSLLPNFKGANAMKESFDSNHTKVGVSVHWVNEELDSGEIILQKEFHRTFKEDFEEFCQKIHLLEYEAYPEAILSILG